MTAAYDAVREAISKQLDGNEERKLALIILQHVDRGKCNAVQLAEIALREWRDTAVRQSQASDSNGLLSAR
jgi:hypothetical protein